MHRVIVKHMGRYNWYIWVDKDNKYFWDDYSKHYDCDVHWGLTFSEKWTVINEMKKDLRYFGFDTHHFWDYKNEIQNKEYINKQINIMEEYFKS